MHIHERVSAKAILKVAERQNVQRELFADPQQDYSKAVDFYQHDVDWANRLILGDSLTVMSSLAHREDLAGKVQMIYIDPPYGIKFASNFQPTVFQRDVKDKEQDLTREREQIKAYRDTWTLGVHSYLAYLRDRLIVAKKLLTDCGSIFVQIGDENVHLVRGLMDEVFGRENFHAQLTFTKTRPLGSQSMPGIVDYIIWYAKNTTMLKYRPLFANKIAGEGNFTYIELPNGERRRLSRAEQDDPSLIDENAHIFQAEKLASSGFTSTCYFDIKFQGNIFPPKRTSWRTNPEGMSRLLKSSRLYAPNNNVSLIKV